MHAWSGANLARSILAKRDHSHGLWPRITTGFNNQWPPLFGGPVFGSGIKQTLKSSWKGCEGAAFVWLFLGFLQEKHLPHVVVRRSILDNMWRIWRRGLGAAFPRFFAREAFQMRHRQKGLQTSILKRVSEESPRWWKHNETKCIGWQEHKRFPSCLGTTAMESHGIHPLTTQRQQTTMSKKTNSTTFTN
jgi:hypothetical protein